MELRALRAFVEVARSGSFTLAAEHLAVTQPTISKLIARLEDELGQPLFQRHRRQAELTDGGRVVLSYAENMLANAANIRRALDELAGLQKGDLRIGIPPLGPRLFVPLLGDFKLRHPDIELKLFEDGSHAIVTALIDGQLELGGLLAPVDEARFEYRGLVDDRLALLAPASSCWAKRDEVRLGELAEEPFILFPPAYAINERIEQACQQCGFAPEVVGRSGQIGLILEMVRYGVGICLLPSSQLGPLDLSEFSVSTLTDPVIPWRIELAWLRGSYLSAAAKAWLAMLDSAG
ncbi:LysR substrate-binding domain-containing protein [Curvibacter lanceolatus]|uniref:LysR substrate-binding domain-containing protein n=1 Tax=Curvibacter lanceolatus TaxID=86182 RepID=UPI00036B1FA7|nr:LysR substrate-binding domain-containing protein [Curvibacter lanceolatus]